MCRTDIRTLLGRDLTFPQPCQGRLGQKVVSNSPVFSDFHSSTADPSRDPAGWQHGWGRGSQCIEIKSLVSLCSRCTGSRGPSAMFPALRSSQGTPHSCIGAHLPCHRWEDDPKGECPSHQWSPHGRAHKTSRYTKTLISSVWVNVGLKASTEEAGS